MTPSEQVEYFLQRVDELPRTRLGQSGMGSGFTIRFEQMKGMQFELREPDETELKEFLMTLRLFVLKKDPVYVERIANICWQSISSDHIRGELAKAKADWKQRKKTGEINFVVNEQHVEPAQLLDLWINGYYFHTDATKLKELQRIMGGVLGLTRYMFVQLVMDCARYVEYLANVIRFASREGLLDTSRAA